MVLTKVTRLNYTEMDFNPLVIFAEESLAVWFLLFLVEELVKVVEGRLLIAVNVVPPGKYLSNQISKSRLNI